ncbi:uncharacterized protein LOC128982623 [Macrosteles quadrilineatus]|uniref:uncharacterized protein LOC128982623 n=1 Tax=Macrosteles quadrilineatus TaxID=74068 RepID=UPI0023E30E66|nr:uncharacterized protein LOC128982623 [Macrosteles quadrilineatus]
MDPIAAETSKVETTDISHTRTEDPGEALTKEWPRQETAIVAAAAAEVALVGLRVVEGMEGLSAMEVVHTRVTDHLLHSNTTATLADTTAGDEPTTLVIFNFFLNFV